MVAIDFRINAVLSATQSIPSREYQAAKLYSGDSEKKKSNLQLSVKSTQGWHCFCLSLLSDLVKKFAPKFQLLFRRTKNNVR